MGLKGKTPKIGSNSNSCALSSRMDNVSDEKKMTKLLYARIISEHTKIDTLFVNGSQVNLISEEIVKKLGLETKPHPKPFPLGWVRENTQMQVTK